MTRAEIRGVFKDPKAELAWELWADPESFREGDWIKCPICGEELEGIDEAIMHAQGHVALLLMEQDIDGVVKRFVKRDP